MTAPVPAFALPPPHSLDAERFVVGWLIYNPDDFDDVAARLDMRDFYLPAHRTVYGAMLELREARKPVNAITLLESLKALRRLDLAGGEEGLRAMALATQLGADLDECVHLIREKATARGVIDAARDVMNRAYDETASGSSLVESMRASATALERGTNRGPTNVRDMLDEAFAEIGSDVGPTGIPTGFAALSRKIPTGFEAGQLILIGARPGMGKTALGVNLAMRMIADGVTVGFMSFEMSQKQMVRRLIAARAQVNMRHLSGGRFITDAERDAVAFAIEALRTNGAPLFIDDGSGPTTAALRSRARVLVERHGCRILFVDHLGLVRAPSSDRTIRSTVDVVSHVSRELKALALDLGVPIVAMCQLSREAAKGNKSDDPGKIQPPTLTDLRDSGSLEQDADMVMLVHRPGYYTKRDEAETQVIIAKQRDGETGTANLSWAGWCQRFTDVDVPA